ncbi:MAG: hypothetical protein M0D57_20475 [Sphingobacteriales bacterium JAD_PAG50586_3]|nr:MAG: hypothetical protein M0D57_20475 [Sphingobacteriales bacterium JAD_PAG50586_3]
MIICILVFAFGCGSGGNKPDKPVARAGKYYLDEVELRTILPKNINSADSALFAKNYIERWAKDNILIDKAEDEGIDDVNIDKMVENYRKQLLLAAYQKNTLKLTWILLLAIRMLTSITKVTSKYFSLKAIL